MRIHIIYSMKDRFYWGIMGAMIVATAASAVNVADTMTTWLLEATPVLIAVVVLCLTHKSFRLTNLLYVLILIHALVLLYGAHYSYAQAPLGDWMSHIAGWERNNYDKIGHIMQGFCPVIAIREVLLRKSPLRRGKWLAFICAAIALAISACYEMIEWAASLTAPNDTEAFLGTQGYIWDTQSDMFCCLVGACLSLLLLSRLHNRQLEALLSRQ